MASAARRRAAGSKGTTAAPEPETPVGKRVAAKNTAGDQAKVLMPERVTFEVARGEEKIRITVPTQFTIGQIVSQRVYDDLNAFAHLVLVEANNVAPPEVVERPALMFEEHNAGYLEVALLKGGVAAMTRQLAQAVGTIVDPETGETARPLMSDLQQLSSKDTLMLGCWFFRRWLQVKGREKNALRAVPG